MLDIGPLQKVCRPRLQRDGSRIGKNIATILQHPNLNIKIFRRGIIRGQVQVHGIAILAQQGVITGQEGAFRAGDVVLQSRMCTLSERPAKGDDATQTVHEIGQGAALVSLDAAVEYYDAGYVARVCLQDGAVGGYDLQEGLKQLLDLGGDLADAGFLHCGEMDG